MNGDTYHGLPWSEVAAVTRTAGRRHGVRYRDLDDFAQAVAERLLQAQIPHRGERSSLRAFIYRVAWREAADQARRDGRHLRLDLDDDLALSYITHDCPRLAAVETLDLLRRLPLNDARALFAAFIVGLNANRGRYTHEGEHAAEIHALLIGAPNAAAAAKRLERARRKAAA